MAGRLTSAPVRPEREERAGRRLAIPFVFMAVLVAVVLTAVLLVVQPWDGDEAIQRDTPPAVPAVETATP